MKNISTWLLCATFSVLAFVAGTVNAGQQQLSPQTMKNLETAMHGEAYAYLKYKAYAEQAHEQGKPEIARVFEDSADVEANEHFAREAGLLGLVRDNESNLLDSMAGEHYENTKMYVKFAEQAEAAGDTRAASLFRQIASDEGEHYQNFRAALEKLRTQGKKTDKQ